MRRVVITGIGLCAPVDWEGILRGQCGLRTPAGWTIAPPALRAGLVTEPISDLVRSLPAGPGGPCRPDRLDPFSQFALVAAQRARADACLTDSDLSEAAVIVASAMGGEQTRDRGSRHLEEHILTGRKLRHSAFTAPKLMPNAASANIGMLLRAYGPNVSPAAACASGAYAVAQAADMIRSGRIDLAFTGASEAPCEEIAALVFRAGDALSPDGSSLPFSRQRNGFCLAEGSAVLVLEEEEHARARGARILARWGGAGLTCDAHHVVAPNPEGLQAARAMTLALREANLEPGDVGYINAHATGTPLGDAAECRAIRKVWGGQRPLVSSTKGATGHLLGAAGALEAAYTVLAIHHGIAPATIGVSQDEIDPECADGLDILWNEPRRLELKAAMSNSFAFGGHNASLVFLRDEGGIGRV